MINTKEIQIIDYDDSSEVLIFNEEVPKYDGYEFDIFDEHDFDKYIKYIEKIVRNSFEYRHFVKFLRDNVGMNKCSFMENVNNIETFNVKIHLHHHPFDLYTITKIVFNRRFEAKELLETEAVAKEVMWIHSNLLIGLIPLCETVHELVHNSYLFIPEDNVLGLVDLFIELYRPWISDEQMDLYNSIKEYSRIYDEQSNKNPLVRKYIYIDTQVGTYKLPSYQDVLNAMNKHIKELKEFNGRILQPAIEFKENI